MSYNYIYFNKPVTLSVHDKKTNLYGFHNINDQSSITQYHNKNFIYIPMKIVSLNEKKIIIEYFYKNNTVDKLLYSNIYNIFIDESNSWQCTQHIISKKSILCKYLKVYTVFSDKDRMKN